MRLNEGSSVYLDLVRGVSAQIVVFGHAISYFGVLNFLHEPNVPWMQNVGVVVFFVLSGFVISFTVSTKLQDDSSYGFYDYFADRFSRIFSAFVPVMFVVLAIDAFSFHLDPTAYKYADAFDLRTFIANLMMLQDFPFRPLKTADCCTSFGSARPFWTLAIEWWIYLFFGFLVLVAAKRPSLGTLVASIVLSVVPVYNLVGGRGNGLTAYWIFGAIAYLLVADGRVMNIKRSMKVTIVLVASVVAGLRARAVGMSAYDPVFALMLAAAFVYGLDLFSRVTFSERWSRVIRGNARFSFTLYLIHCSILDFMSTHLSMIDPYVLLVLGLTISSVVSLGIARITEETLTKVVRGKLRSLGHRRVVAG